MTALSALFNRLWFRLTLAFVFVVLIGVLVNTFISLYLGIQEINAIRGEDYWELDATFQFTQSGGVLDALTTYYDERGSWDGIEQTMHTVQSFDIPNQTIQVGYAFRDQNGVILYDTRPQLGEWLNVDVNQSFPIVVNGKKVGKLTVVIVNNVQDFVRTNSLSQFIQEWLRGWIRDQVGIMTAIGAAISITFGFLMSRGLVAPIKRLSEASQQINAYNLTKRVEVRGSTEVTNLAISFNSMLQRLEEAEQLRSNLVADVAHELRTPLTTLQGNLRAILDDVYPLTKSEVAGLYDQTRLLSRLVNDLHEISQAEANKLPLSKVYIDVGELLHNIGTSFGPVAEINEVSLVVRTQMKLIVHGDPARLSQVMHNLLANALHHTPSNGRITIHAQKHEETIYISVMDTGMGISAEHLPHVFERFYRADRARSRNRGGSGLGLAITKAIVNAHNGQITVESDGIGCGSTFTIELPAEAAVQQESTWISKSSEILLTG